MTTFVDRVELHVAAGNGGHGCASVHREKFKPLGGPDGGNGGRGGDVILVVEQSITTLLEYHHSPHRKATNGQPGAGDNRSGKDGQDIILPVPDGTVVLDKEGNVLADLVGQGTTYVAAEGGRGGLGNAALSSARRKAPASPSSAYRAPAATSSWSSRPSPTWRWSASRAPASPR